MPATVSQRFRFVYPSLVAATFVLLGVAAQSARAADVSCSRACLKGMVDKYTAAMVAHDPSMAPFADNVKFTENGQALTFHQGLWATAAADSKYRLYVLDTVNESAGFLGQMKEHEDPVLVALRLKVVDGKITEAEQLVLRPGPNSFGNPKAFKRPLRILTEKLKPSEQVSREAMRAAANHYFTGLDTENSGANVPFDPKCQRRENGAITANNPNGKGMAKLGCKAQFDTGFSVLVSDVRDRRFPVIDRQTGLVFTLVFFDQNGRAKQYTQPDGTVVPIKPPFTQPLTFQIAEIFKIKSGKIRQIEALVNQVPYKMRSGWSGNLVSQSTASESTSTASAACDAACLTADFDRLLQAIVDHDPSKAPLADNVKYTENAQVLKVGDGIWGVASALPTNYKLVIPDPTLGQLAFHVVMKESGRPVWYAGRMKVENQKITQLETIVVRRGGFADYSRTPAPVWAAVVAPDQRSSRDVMIKDANMYFDALQDNKANYVPFADDCGRVENGVVTANNPKAKGQPGRPNIGAMSCTGNINSMMWRYITKIDQRHLAAIDETHGIVSMVAMFNQAGDVDSTVIPGFGKYKYTGAAHRPFNALILESFKVVNGKIRQIAATLSTLPYGSKDGWGD